MALQYAEQLVLHGEVMDALKTLTDKVQKLSDDMDNLREQVRGMSNILDMHRPIGPGSALLPPEIKLPDPETIKRATQLIPPDCPHYMCGQCYKDGESICICPKACGGKCPYDTTSEATPPINPCTASSAGTSPDVPKMSQSPVVETEEAHTVTTC